MLTESLVLAALGAAGGLLVARGALGLLRALGPAGVARLDRVGIDGGVLAFVTAAAVGTALVFGLVPAWQAARSSGADRLKDGVRTTTGGSAWLRRTLIVGEVALSVMLLVGAGLLLRSFDRLSRVPPGIDPSQALTFRITLPQRPYSDDVRVAGFYSTLMDRLRALPGVDAAGGAVRLSLEGANWTGDLFVESRPEVWGRELRHKAITSGYLAAVRLPLLRGRDFDDRIDTFTAPRVVLVNQSLVRRYLGDLDPIGQRIAFSRPASTTRWVTIVGVVADEKQDSLSADVRPEVYDPQTQDSANTMSVVVRTGADLAALVPLVRRELAAVDPAVAMYDVRTFDEVVRRSLAPQRFALLAIGLFAAMALVLAMVGLYGTVAFAVTQRRREIGVRLALGANRPDVVRMILWDGVRLVLAGLAIGIGVAVAMSRTIAGFLYAVRPADPYVLMAVTALLALAGVAASYLPALRASRVDPALSLRAE
jgi:predicted permease